jgi:hypothetical protein
MTKTYFPDSRVRQRLYEGALAIYFDAFVEQLVRVVLKRLLLCRVLYALEPDIHWI